MSDQHADSVWDARPINDQLREACSAVLHGAIWSGFDGPDGVSKDEALGYAAKLATWVQGILDESDARYFRMDPSQRPDYEWTQDKHTEQFDGKSAGQDDPLRRKGAQFDGSSDNEGGGSVGA